MTAVALAQPCLMDMPMAGVYPIPVDAANDMLVDWGHKLGAVNRPFRQEAFGLRMADTWLSVAVSASVVSSTVAGFTRTQVVELARLCSDPTEPWATRVMMRLWREVCAPNWSCWEVRAAISYSHNTMHSGNLYRFDGWEKIAEDCGSSGGGAWSRKRYATDAVHGKKTLWLWRYDDGGPV